MAASNSVYTEVSTCYNFGTNKASCDGDSNCNFLFFQDPLTAASS